MAWVPYDSLSPDEARRLADAWWQSRADRIDWLRAAMRQDEPDLMSAWTWYLTNQHAPSKTFLPNEKTGLPVWFDDSKPDEPGSLGRAQSLGLDACFHLLDALLYRTFPELERTIFIPSEWGRNTLYDNRPANCIRNPEITYAWSPVRAMGVIGRRAFRGEEARDTRLQELFDLQCLEIRQALSTN